jgi:hypothetical protein
MSYDIGLVLEDFKVNAQSRQIDFKFINKPWLEENYVHTSRNW